MPGSKTLGREPACVPQWNKPAPPLYAPVTCDAAFPRSRGNGLRWWMLIFALAKRIPGEVPAEKGAEHSAEARKREGERDASREPPSDD